MTEKETNQINIRKDAGPVQSFASLKIPECATSHPGIRLMYWKSRKRESGLPIDLFGSLDGACEHVLRHEIRESGQLIGRDVRRHGVGG